MVCLFNVISGILFTDTIDIFTSKRINKNIIEELESRKQRYYNKTDIKIVLLGNNITTKILILFGNDVTTARLISKDYCLEMPLLQRD